MRRCVPTLLILFLALMVAFGSPAAAKKKSAEPPEKDAAAEDEGPFTAGTFSGLTLRGIGPAVTSGRIGDLAVRPDKPWIYFVAAASGGVWKTVNGGVTFSPVFDSQGSYSIGCITIDPSNPLVVWAGTGENNSQRSVSYGDGVYRSLNGGKTWENMGLGNSEHIGRIVVDPRDSNTVYVAAQGPLWAPGGDRGLYKTTDGGKTWEAVLSISENTGVTDIAIDPRNPDVIYAASYQRRRHTWTLINGGPESGLHKSLDGGATWEELDLVQSEGNLPEPDMGRIGIAVAPASPDVVYAVVEAALDAGGFYASTDAGVTWEKRNDYVSDAAQYYNEIIPDPHNVDRIYSLDTWMHVTEDGGATWQRMVEVRGGYTKHVDDHALWIDPSNTDHLLNGNDGGVYESFDRGATWHFKANLPVTQFYRATADNDYPFYNVYGGTQDNATLGGPARTAGSDGITNADWYVTVFGDGFKTRVDPENADIVYSQWQYGGLVRYDRKSREIIDIQPQPGKDDDPLRWNWNSPLIISPHSHTRLYYAAQRIFRSDDRGNSWTPVSPDLSRGIDRNTLEVMGKVWSIDAVAKNASTSFYGNIVSLSESPLVEGLLYAGLDDGLIQVSEDGGASWRKIESFPDVPEMTYVSDIEASLHDADTVFASFDNHKQGDFKPYVLKSADRGMTWGAITGDLPERGSVHSLAEDHENPKLLFAGAEFGVFFTVDGGTAWLQLKGGMPVVAVRDIDIQRRENDLVLGTFGRGFYILDDYSPLRTVTPDLLEEEAFLFPVKKTWMFHETARLGLDGVAFQGDSYYSAPNPPFGAIFTYYLKETPKTKREARLTEEKEVDEDDGIISYPTWDALREEDREEAPLLVFTITDSEGNVVRRLTEKPSSGIHRLAWDLRLPASNPVNLEPRTSGSPWDEPPQGPMAVPGTYTVSVSLRTGGEEKPLAEPQSFITEPLGMASLPTEDRDALAAFQEKTAGLQRAVLGAVRTAGEAENRLAHIKQAVLDTPGADPALLEEALGLELRLREIQQRLTGDRVVARHNEPVSPSIVGRVQQIVYGHWSSSSAPTATHLENYEIAGELFEEVLSKMRQLVESDLTALEEKLEDAGAPWTPGRVPVWRR